MSFCSVARSVAVLLIALFFSVGAYSSEETLEWTNAASLTIHGQGWADVRAPFDRFPTRAQEIVRPEVWTLSRDSAGLYVEFLTDSLLVAVRWSLTRQRLALPHMPATGVSGLDLYLWDAALEGWRWSANGRPNSSAGNKQVLVGDLLTLERRYRLYLPLYNGISSLQIGVRGTLRDAGPAERRSVVFYGTSITQGASAMRPGMAYPVLLSRHLGRTAINLGFSGNGRAEPEVGQPVGRAGPSRLRSRSVAQYQRSASNASPGGIHRHSSAGSPADTYPFG